MITALLFECLSPELLSDYLDKHRMAAQADTVEIKRDTGVEHVESDYANPKKHHEVVLKSEYDQLGLWASVKRFRKVSKWNQINGMH